MGIYDRDYMRPESRRARAAGRETARPTLWAGLRFLLWNWWRGLRGKR